MAWDGHWNGPEFKIFSWPNRAFYYPKVASNSQHNQYLVIANAWDTVSRDWNDVAGRLVMADGSMPYAGYSISSQDQALEPSYGEVAYNPVVDEFLVIWQQKGATTFWDIYAARVGGENGTVVEPPGEYAIDDSSVTHHSPKLVVDPQGHYLVAYNGWNNVGTTYVRELDQTGSPIGESFTIGPVEASAGDPLIAIIPDTRQRLVFWREDDGFVESIWGISWYASASQPSGAAFLVARDVHYYPLGLASGSPGALVMYNRESAEGSKSSGGSTGRLRAFFRLSYVKM